jgi:F0F1-type ATP synthase assembly protein I
MAPLCENLHEFVVDFHFAGLRIPPLARPDGKKVASAAGVEAAEPSEASVAKGPLHPRELGYYFALAQVGLEMVAPVAIGIALDHYLGWTPWGVIVGAFIGLVGGIGHLISLTSRRNNNGSSNPQREDS